jgi:hypothetical protein
LHASLGCLCYHVLGDLLVTKAEANVKIFATSGLDFCSTIVEEIGTPDDVILRFILRQSREQATGAKLASDAGLAVSS